MLQFDKGEGKLLRKPNNIIPITLDNNFFKWWCIFLKPFVNLTNKEIDIVACYLKWRFELAKVISDETVLDSQLLSNRVREKVLEECHITKSHFYVIMNNLKKHGIFTDTGINSKLIPNIRPDDNGVFQLLILFKAPDQKPVSES